ncbi:MAG: hypothetical protein QXH37_08720 [Candidatus Bathyarchaeia archaeon]
MFKEDLNEKIGEFEGILQKIASDIASGALFEKLPPEELLGKTEGYVSRLMDLATNSEEQMLILKPEKAFTIKSKCKNFTQTLKNFKDILLQNTVDPIANSRLAFEQLRKAVTDGSDFLFLMREVRDNPSPLIDAVLTFKRASEAKTSVISIQAKEDIQPFIKYILGSVDGLRAALIGLEKKVDEMKQLMRELQEESLKILAGGASSKTQAAPEDKTESKQLSLSNFKTEKN